MKLRTNYTLGDYVVDITNNDSSSGMATGTIVAIVVASVSLVAVAALAFVVLRVRSRHGGKALQVVDELVAAFGRGSEKEPPSAMELLVAKLLSETANPLVRAVQCRCSADAVHNMRTAFPAAMSQFCSLRQLGHECLDVCTYPPASSSSRLSAARPVCHSEYLSAG